GSEMHGRWNGALAVQVDEMRHERLILPVTDFFAPIAVAEFVLEQSCRQRVSLSCGGFEQRRFEGEDCLKPHRPCRWNGILRAKRAMYCIAARRHQEFRAQPRQPASDAEWMFEP